MAQLDIISAASQAYKVSWAGRRYLLRLAAVPLLVKFACITLASSFAGGEDGSYLRFMLIMVPALITVGWLLSHYVRFLVLGHTWPFRATGDMDADLAVLSVRARGVLGGMIVFPLITMARGLRLAVVGEYLGPFMPAASGAPPDVPGYMGIISVLMLAFLFWGFRLLWLYIPYALNIDGWTYLSKIRGASSSLSMIGIWLVCFLPFFLGLRLLAVVVAEPVGVALGSGAASFIALMLTVIADTLKSIVTTAGMTFGIQQMFGPKEQKSV